eukprot:s2397_g5.t1
MVPHQGALREEHPGIFALTRNRYPAELPTGKKLEQIKQQMMRVHRASRHAPFSKLQKLLAVRKAPPRAVELAGNLQCPSCVEAKKSKPAPVASLKETPSLYEIVGMDLFEFEHGVGVLTTPAEAPEMLGAEESCVRVVKEVAKRLMKEDPELNMNNIFQLAEHGCNETSMRLVSRLFNGHEEEQTEINIFLD